jgi:FemAB-related protein (PEP-CTERM system-associated)
VKSQLFGSSLTSLPFLDSSGLVAENDEAKCQLLSASLEKAEALKVDYLELRQANQAVRQASPLSDEFTTDLRKVSLSLDLPTDEELLWKQLSSERRNRIRKAKKNEIEVYAGDLNDLDDFYAVWSRNMRDLGSPAHSKRFFHSVLTEFPDSTVLLLARAEGKVIGGAVAIYFKDTVTLPWVSSLRTKFASCPNNMLYWEAMRFGISKGLQTFDFGRSSVGSGTYQFKTRWGAKPQQLYWECKNFHGKEISRPSGDNHKFDLAMAVWKRLPVSVANLIGPSIRSGITV